MASHIARQRRAPSARSRNHQPAAQCGSVGLAPAIARRAVEAHDAERPGVAASAATERRHPARQLPPGILTSISSGTRPATSPSSSPSVGNLFAAVEQPQTGQAPARRDSTDPHGRRTCRRQSASWKTMT